MKGRVRGGGGFNDLFTAINADCLRGGGGG